MNTLPTCQTKPLRSRMTAIALSVILIMSSLPAHADLEQVMEGAFNSEINVTPAGAYMGARRGSVGGGRVRAANKISSAQLITIVPPGFKAGCGGIDMWAGSFSFISGKQLEALAKNFASNAAGYAFKLALDKFPAAKDVIKELQTLANWANSMSLNSCALAKSAMDPLFKDDEKITNDASLISSKEGSSRDFFSVKNGSDSPLGLASLTSLMDNNSFRPNPIWSAITETDAYAWFPNAGGYSFAEAMMSLTGFAAKKKDEESKDSNGDEVLKHLDRMPTIDVNDLVHGGNVKLLHCLGDLCDDVTENEVKLKGIYSLYYEAFNKSGGIVDKFSTGDTAFTLEETRLMESLRPNLTWMVQDLTRNVSSAKEFASITLESAAYNTACGLGAEIFTAISATVRGRTETGAEASIALIKDARMQMERQCKEARDRIGQQNNIGNVHRQLRAVIKEKG